MRDFISPLRQSVTQGGFRQKRENTAQGLANICWLVGPMSLVSFAVNLAFESGIILWSFWFLLTSAVAWASYKLFLEHIVKRGKARSNNLESFDWTMLVLTYLPSIILYPMVYFWLG